MRTEMTVVVVAAVVVAPALPPSLKPATTATVRANDEADADSMQTKLVFALPDRAVAFDIAFR